MSILSVLTVNCCLGTRAPWTSGHHEHLTFWSNLLFNLEHGALLAFEVHILSMRFGGCGPKYVTNISVNVFFCVGKVYFSEQ